MIPLLNPWSHLWSSFSNSGRSKGEDAVFLSVAAPYYFRILWKWEYHQVWTQLCFFFVSPCQSQISAHPSFFFLSPFLPFLILSPLSLSLEATIFKCPGNYSTFLHNWSSVMTDEHFVPLFGTEPSNLPWFRSWVTFWFSSKFFSFAPSILYISTRVSKNLFPGPYSAGLLAPGFQFCWTFSGLIALRLPRDFGLDWSLRFLDHMPSSFLASSFVFLNTLSGKWWFNSPSLSFPSHFRTVDVTLVLLWNFKADNGSSIIPTL